MSLAAATALSQAASAASFSDDTAFLSKHTDVLILQDRTGQARVAVAPAWQGRVLTSTADGDDGLSFGWINRERIASGEIQPHINVFGGEDRFWLGPEGGQFSIFFAKDAPFDLEHWQTPASIDTDAYEVVRKTRGQVRLRHKVALTNYHGTVLNLQVDRTVRLLRPRQTWRNLDVEPARDVKSVAFESINRITNTGRNPWTRETGMLSVWILGMFNPSPTTTIVIPIRPGPEADLGKPVNADYFGAVPPNRLVVREDVIFFSGDGQYRSKIGVGPQRARPILGSYDEASQVLTLVQFTLPQGAADYVNSMWEIQDQPFAGDVVNSYNDGPPAPGSKPLGPFYELETSSPAAGLEHGQSLEHLHRTIHLQGPRAALDLIARTTLGVSLDEIRGALPR
jgi:hypothetical protein